MRRARRGLNRWSIPLRRWYYVRGGHRKFPAGIREHLGSILGLDDESAIGSRRIEIGPGPHPTPGFVHMDIDPYGPHLEAIGVMWRLPFRSDWATEIRAIHALEHVHPSQLVDTLLEWHRVLQAGGKVLISVPNAPAIMRAFERVPVPEKWPLLGSILGMYCDAGIRSAGALTVRSDHQIVFDWPLLEWALQAAGFGAIENLSDRWTDRHSRAWSLVVPRYSLVATAAASLD